MIQVHGDLRDVLQMPYVEYDEPTLQVRSDSDILIRDRDMWVNGFGLLIQLRPKDEPEESGIADRAKRQSAALARHRLRPK